MHQDKLQIFAKRMDKLNKHFKALDDYKTLIGQMLEYQNIYNPQIFEDLAVRDRAVLDAYLKRFSSVQDFLGAKIWSMMFGFVGIPAKAMTEVLYHAVKEGVLDSLENWIEIREIRNELAHDYPDELEDALRDLQFCIDHYDALKTYYDNTLAFCAKHKVLKQ
ncbi:MAG: hypothetical protein O2809_01970 [Proteobacteria bacterium]|nr:hypothetical protein [Pseudomonadota bacterium]